MEHVVYVPTGFYYGYQAWRKNVSGIVKGPLPFFWGVAKACSSAAQDACSPTSSDASWRPSR